MSVQKDSGRITVPHIRARKAASPIVCLTCYHAAAHGAAPRSSRRSHAGGRSLGMVMHGMETTLGVTLELMILHCQAVMRGSRRALIVLDMPFGSYMKRARRSLSATPRAR